MIEGWDVFVSRRKELRGPKRVYGFHAEESWRRALGRIVSQGGALASEAERRLADKVGPGEE